MKLSLSNGVFSRLSLEENFQTVVTLGFRNIEFNMKIVQKENDTDVYREQRLLKTTGLNCLTHHCASLHVKDPLEVHRAVYYAKISLECAHALGAPVMTVHSNVDKRLPRQVREQCLRGVFGEVVPFAAQLGIKLALENLSYTSTGFGKNVEELEEVLGVIDEEGAMGITFDLCHALETKETQNLLEKYGNRVCNVHMANKAHKAFTAATPALSAFLEGLSSFRYEGPITLELSQGTTIEKIAQTKAFFDGFLEQFRG
ncbi:MAG: sugar phosphate isomerase/epimerase [Candidatus Bathyarchaeota archaeon]|nr:sugar phosphate isomerase/epimerase [Candidatus Bathyarchaeota archaeon]